MLFNKPPRIQKSFGIQEVNFPVPDALSEKPKVNWVTLLLPALGTGLAVVLLVLILGSAQSTSLIMFLPLLIPTVLASVISFWMESREYEAKKKLSLQHYDEQLSETENDIQKLSISEKEIALEFSPDISGCLERTNNRDLRLGERRPGDHDFLKLRLGVATAPSAIRFLIPDNVGKQEAFAELDRRALGIRDKFKVQNEFPILLDLVDIGCAGICGEKELTREVTRSLMLHLATHHWYSEVKTIIFSGSLAGAAKWNWVDKLPHGASLASSTVIPLEGNERSRLIIEALEAELRKRKAIIYRQSVTSSDLHTYPLPAIVVVFDRVPDIDKHAAFSTILKNGKSLGVFGIFLTDQFIDLPSECSAVITVEKEKGSLGRTGEDNDLVDSIELDKTSLSQAEQFATFLAKIDWVETVDATEPPDNITLLDLLNVKTVDELNIQNWWDGDYPYGYLRAPIGKFTKSAELILDLNEASETGETHGPHGVIGGTTGSGKSELLRTIILALAMTHHPYDVNFALIDYKGGGAFKDLEKLPHVVGVITDIENHDNYASRVIQSLTGEINSRKSLLGRSQKEMGIERVHIDDYRKLSAKRPLPRLIIIFDEYAEFKDRHPDETRKLINIARQGRSLGIHLVLCTQNPATAVDDQVRQNTKFSICMSVNSPDDSSGLIGIPDAFGLPRGRAFIKVTNPQKFQVGYSGERYSEEETQARAIVRTLIETNNKLKLPAPPKVWPSPLPEKLFLPELITPLVDNSQIQEWSENSWKNPKGRYKHVIGLIDDPIHQIQPIYYFGRPNSGQNMIVIGGPKSGKSTFLLTLAISIAESNSPSQSWIYVLDLGGQSLLYKLKDLPHVAEEGGIIGANEKERINRLFGELRTQISSRRALFEKHGSSSDLTSYNNAVPLDQQLPQIYLLIDGLTSQFAEGLDGFTEQLIDIILEGHSVGINVVITANLPQDINPKIFAYVSERIVLRPAEKSLIEQTFELSPVSIQNIIFGQDLPAGRGFKGGNGLLEFQIALPVSVADEVELSSQIDLLIIKMKIAWENAGGKHPPSIRVLPDFVGYSDIDASPNPSPVHLFTYLGVSRETMMPIGFSLESEGPSILIASSSPQRGKTTLLTNWLVSLSEKYTQDEVKFWIIDYHRHSLRHLVDLPHAIFVTKHQELMPMLTALKEQISHREKKFENEFNKSPTTFNETQANRKLGFNIIVIDDYKAFGRKSLPEERSLLVECITDGEDFGVRLIVAENTSLLGFPSQDEIMEKVAQDASGIALGPYENLDNYFAQLILPAAQKTNDYPIGRAYLISRGKISLFQAQAFWNSDTDPHAVIVERIKRLKRKHPTTPN